MLRTHGHVIRKARTLEDIHIYDKLVLRHCLFKIRIQEYEYYK